MQFAQNKINSAAGYLIAFCIGIAVGFRTFPEFVGFVYMLVAIACVYLAFQLKTTSMFALMPYLIYTEMFVRVFVHTVPYLFLQYFFIGIFSILILKKESKVRLHSKAFVLLFFFIIIEFINGTRANAPDIARGLLINTLALAVIIMWSSFNTLSTTTVNVILKHVKYASIYLCGIIIARYLMGDVEFRASSGSEGTNGLAPVQLSGYLGFSCTVFFYSIMNGERKNILLNLAALCLMSIIMLLSFSRGGIYFLGVMMALYFVFNWTSVKKYFLVLLLIPVGFFAYSYASQKTKGLIENRYEQKGSSGRDQLAKAAWILFEQQPLVGVGPSNFNTEITNQDLYQVESGSHNEFMRVAAEDGILGMITYWSFFIVTLIGILRRSKVSREYGVYFLVFFCLVAVHNGLKISIQPLVMMLAVATPGLIKIKKKANVPVAANTVITH
jgi:O-antigen ligase